MPYIVSKNADALIAYKPVGILSEFSGRDKNNIVTLVRDELVELGEPADLYTVHRLDRTVGGLLVLARTKKAAAELSLLASLEGFGKEYLLVAEGVPESREGSYTDYLKRDKILGKAIPSSASDKNAKSARLNYRVLSTKKHAKGVISLIHVTLETGRFHQIRVQFSLRGMPLVGDSKYGSRNRLSRTPALFCPRIETNTANGQLSGMALPQLNEYPWSEFESDINNFLLENKND